MNETRPKYQHDALSFQLLFDLGFSVYLHRIPKEGSPIDLYGIDIYKEPLVDGTAKITCTGLSYMEALESMFEAIKVTDLSIIGKPFTGGTVVGKM